MATHTGGYGEVVANTAVFSQAFSSGGAAQAVFEVIGPPQLGLSSTGLDFGSQLVGTASAAQSVVVSNTGAAPLELTNVAISGDFSIQANTCPAILAGGANCTLDITFSPAITGPTTGGLTFSSNAAGSPHTVILDGVGIAPWLLLGKQVVPDTDVAYHGEVTYTVGLANLGTANASGVILTDTLPLSATFARWVDNHGGATFLNNRITWSGAVTMGQAISFTFIAAHTGSYGDEVTNIAQYGYGRAGGAAQAPLPLSRTPRRPVGRFICPLSCVRL